MQSTSLSRDILNQVGKKFGELTIVCRAQPDKYDRERWECRCDCGARVRALPDQIINGARKRCHKCGLARRGQKPNRLTQASNITKKRFGSLVAVSQGESDRYGKPSWNCACDCGGTITVRVDNLVYGRTVRCAACRSKPRGPHKAPKRRTAAQLAPVPGRPAPMQGASNLTASNLTASNLTASTPDTSQHDVSSHVPQPDPQPDPQPVNTLPDYDDQADIWG